MEARLKQQQSVLFNLPQSEDDKKTQEWGDIVSVYRSLATYRICPQQTRLFRLSLRIFEGVASGQGICERKDTLHFSIRGLQKMSFGQTQGRQGKYPFQAYKRGKS